MDQYVITELPGSKPGILSLGTYMLCKRQEVNGRVFYRMMAMGSWSNMSAILEDLNK